MTETKVVDIRKDSGVKASLPSFTKVIHIEYKDPLGQTYGGDFTVKRLTVDEIRRIGIRKAQLNGGMSDESLGYDIQLFNRMLAHLEHAIVQAPEWWKPLEFYSAEVIGQLYTEVMNFEESFRQPIQEQPQIIKRDSTVESKPAGSITTKVVGQEVSFAYDV